MRIKNALRLRRFVLAQCERALRKQVAIRYIFCNDEMLLGINRQFLRHDFYTDIITFPLGETKEKLEAEIYISTERVTENAATYKVSFDEELQRVIFHGALHLLGYADKTKAQQKAMRQKENDWLKKFGKG